MPYYVTKWALTRGIIEVTDQQFKKLFSIRTTDAGTSYLAGNNSGPFWTWFLQIGKDCFTDRDEALCDAERRKSTKRRSLRKQLKALETKSIDVVRLAHQNQE